MCPITNICKYIPYIRVLVHNSMFCSTSLCRLSHCLSHLFNRLWASRPLSEFTSLSESISAFWVCTALFSCHIITITKLSQHLFILSHTIPVSFPFWQLLWLSIPILIFSHHVQSSSSYHKCHISRWPKLAHLEGVNYNSSMCQ